MCNQRIGRLNFVCCLRHAPIFQRLFANLVVCKLNSDWRKLEREFTKDVCDGDRKRACKRIGDYVGKERTEKVELRSELSRNDNSLHSSDLYDAPNSQESMLEEIYNLDKEIQTQSESLITCRKSLAGKETRI